MSSKNVEGSTALVGSAVGSAIGPLGVLATRASNAYKLEGRNKIDPSKYSRSFTRGAAAGAAINPIAFGASTTGSLTNAALDFGSYTSQASLAGLNATKQAYSTVAPRVKQTTAQLLSSIKPPKHRSSRRRSSRRRSSRRRSSRRRSSRY